MDAPKRIWVEDEFGADDDQWLYGAWDCTRQRGYQTEYILASEHARIVAEKDARIAELEGALETARRDALEEAERVCNDEADKCDDAVKWGGHPKYIANCKAAAYAMRDRAAAIRAIAEKG